MRSDGGAPRTTPPRLLTRLLASALPRDRRGRSILGDAQANFFPAPWLGIYPGIVLVVIALSAVLVGDGLRDLTASSEE